MSHSAIRSQQATAAAVGVEITELLQKGCLLNAKLTTTNSSTTFAEKTSRELVINDAAVFQLRLVVMQVNNSNTYNNLLFVKFTKSRLDDDLNYTILFNCADLKVTQTFATDNGTWHLVHQNKDNKQILSCNVSVEMHLKENASPFAALHDDTELTDFELRGKDGSVRVHRTVLAAASPVLRRMMSGAWREATEGHVDVTGTSRATLEHLKNYIYLHKLPQTGLEQLLLLSCYYMMPELERRCVDMLVRDLDSQNACDLIEFAAKNNVKRLLVAVLECVQSGAISVSEIRDHLGESDETDDDETSEEQ